jgi:SNF2 family DNA or RNA helicase
VQGLVIAQGVLKYQWSEQIAKFTGGHPLRSGRYAGGAETVVVDGDREKRAQAYRDARNGVRDGLKVYRPRYVVLGYDQIVDDYGAVEALGADFAIGDEITMIKSASADRSQALKTLRPEFIAGMTGDPIENSALELFSIMEWIDPTVLGDPDIFDRTYVDRAPGKGFVLGYKNLDVLHQVMEEARAWFVLDENDRRIAPFLPRMRAPENVYVELDKEAARLYTTVSGELLSDLVELARKRRKISVTQLYAGNAQTDNEVGRAAAKLLTLRMLCAGPYVLRQSISAYQQGGTAARKGSAYAATLAADAVQLSETPKLDMAVRILDGLLEEDERTKICVFSWFKDVAVLLAAQYPGEAVIHNGDMAAKRKNEAKKQFQTDSATRLFLSSDAGGYGVDLPQARVVFNYDVPFSAVLQRQRNTRHRRANSMWDEVRVINLLVSGSVEEYYAARTALKQQLGQAVRGGTRKLRTVSMSLNSLSDWLIENQV